MAFIFYHFFVNLATVCRSILFCFVLQSLKYWHLQAIFINGSKACAWLIYKSAAPLTARLMPRRHPLAALAGAEAKRTPQRANKPKTVQKARRRRGIAAEPLGDCRAHLSPRTAFFPSVLYRYCFPLQGTPRFCYVTFGNRAITSLSLDCPMYSPSIQHPKSSKSMNFLPSRP